MDERYSRQILFKEVGVQGQKKLCSSSAAVVGLGGLGSVAAELLARAGVGSLTLIDNDVVEESNLARQLFTEKDAGKSKASAMKKRIQGINSGVKVRALCAELSEGNAEKLLRGHSVVLDCTDNVKARLAINRCCLRLDIPWVHAAVSGASGTVMSIVPNGTGKSEGREGNGADGRPCFCCVFGKASSHGCRLPSCRAEGVLNTATAMIAAIQTSRALRVLLGKEKGEEVLHIDAWSGAVKISAARKRKGCEACGRDRP